jgi:polyisoprenyl-phosphate glycosyltransferase
VHDKASGWKANPQSMQLSQECRLSFVVPLYNEEEALEAFFARTVPIIEALTSHYEIICVNDGSVDRTLQLLQAAQAQNPRIKIISLTRNFGKEAALTAGIDYTRGDAVIPLDADLQDPPEVIPALVAKWDEGHDMVLAVRHDRRAEALVKRLTAAVFYRVMARVSDVPIPENTGDFRLLDRRVVEALQCLPERTRFMKGLFAWLGFKYATVYYVRPERVAGSSKWQLWKLWNFALEGIFSFTTLPLRMWTYGGLLMASAALAYMGFILGRTLWFGVDVPGYASLVVIMLFFSGMQMIGLGILGEYLGRVFIEVKQRPLYLVRDAMGFDPVSSPVPPRPQVTPESATEARDEKRQAY